MSKIDELTVKIGNLQQAEALTEAAKQLGLTGLASDLPVHGALKAALSGGRRERFDFAATRKALRDSIKDKERYLQKKQLQAYTAGTSAGVVRLVDRWLAYGTMPTLLQDYITEQAGVVDSRLEVQTITLSTDSATIVNEGGAKPEVTRDHLTRLSTTLKVGITEVITAEVESYLMRHAGFQEALELDLLVKIEEAISNTIATTMLGSLVAFPAATYSGTIPSASWADLIALVLNHARDNNILYETRRVQSEADLVVLPLRYYTLFPMALKDTQARRLYASFAEAFARPDVRVAAHTLTAGALGNTAAVVYPLEWGVAYGDGTVSVDYISLPDGTNRKRIEMHVFVNIFFTPQSATRGWGYITNLVNDRATINV